MTNTTDYAKQARELRHHLNELDLAKDRAKYFGLGIPLGKKGVK